MNMNIYCLYLTVSLTPPLILIVLLASNQAILL